MARFYRDATEIEEHTVSQIDRTREHLIETYRKKAKHYDITSRLYPAPGYPQRAQRRRAVQALGLRAGDNVIDIACGTGLNFPLIEEVIGPDGRIVGVDLTDAMLAHAQDRIETNGWSNISLVQADAADFDFPGGTLPAGKVTFNSGDTSKVITINVVGDTTVEPNETFTVTLANPSAPGSRHNPPAAQSAGYRPVSEAGNNLANPTLGTLYRIALALGKVIACVLQDAPADPPGKRRPARAR